MTFPGNHCRRRLLNSNAQSKVLVNILERFWSLPTGIFSALECSEALSLAKKGPNPRGESGTGAADFQAPKSAGRARPRIEHGVRQTPTELRQAEHGRQNFLAKIPCRPPKHPKKEFCSGSRGVFHTVAWRKSRIPYRCLAETRFFIPFAVSAGA